MIFLSRRLLFRSFFIFTGCIFVGACIYIIYIFYFKIANNSCLSMFWLILLHVFAVLITLVLPLFFVENSIESIQHKFFAYKNYFR